MSDKKKYKPRRIIGNNVEMDGDIGEERWAEIGEQKRGWERVGGL